MYRYSTELAPVYLAIAVKSLVTVVLLFLPAQKKEAKDKESARMVIRRCSGSSSSPEDIQSQGSSA